MAYPETTLPEASYLLVTLPELGTLKNCSVYLLYSDRFKIWNLDEGQGILNYDESSKSYPAESLEAFEQFLLSKVNDPKIKAFIAMDIPAFSVMSQIHAKMAIFNDSMHLMKYGVFVPKP